MAKWKGIVGSAFTPDEFDNYCHGLVWTAWRPSFITLHNTAVPSLAQRPNGLTKQHIRNLESFYRDEQGWSAGPHLFIDDRQIWVFTPLTLSGVHSPSWNKVALGVEMLGDYAKEAFDAGRGAAVRRNTVSALATLSAVLGISPDTMRLHKEDPGTTHDCPGKNVRKQEVIDEVEELLAQRHGVEHFAAAAPRRVLVLGQRVPNVSEAQAVGPFEKAIARGTPAFKALVRNTNPDVVFKQEEPNPHDDQTMTARLSERVDRLADLVKAEFPNLNLRITEAWDNGSVHAETSRHREGRAIDFTTSDRDRRKYGRLAGLAVEAGFDWVYYEAADHVHASVRKP